MARNVASASASGRAGGRSSGRPVRIAAGPAQEARERGGEQRQVDGQADDPLLRGDR